MRPKSRPSGRGSSRSLIAWRDDLPSDRTGVRPTGQSSFRAKDVQGHGTNCTSFEKTSPSDETLWTISPILTRRPGRYRIALRNDQGPWNRRVGVASSVEAYIKDDKSA